jgi:hypothetical protein
MCETWSHVGNGALPPTFEQWLAVRTAENEESLPEIELDDMRIFNAIEKLVTSLPQHGFGLAHIVKRGVTRGEAVRNLAQLIVRDFRLPTQYTKRIEELFEHYVKDAKEIADLAQVGVTNRVYGAVNEAYLQLAERTAKSVSSLGAERAIGRVEGAASVLVSLEVMNRDVAVEKTNAFKLHARSMPKRRWVNKIFGGSDKEV